MYIQNMLNFIYIYIYIFEKKLLLLLLLFWWSPLIPHRNLDEDFTHNHMAILS